MSSRAALDEIMALSKARIAPLEAQLLELESKVKLLERQAKSQDPRLIKYLVTNIAKLEKKLEALKKAVALALIDQTEPRSPSEAKIKTEALRAGTIEFCKQLNVDPALWKNIEF